MNCINEWLFEKSQADYIFCTPSDVVNIVQSCRISNNNSAYSPFQFMSITGTYSDFNGFRFFQAIFGMEMLGDFSGFKFFVSYPDFIEIGQTQDFKKNKKVPFDIKQNREFRISI